jgi:hypothetical protein
LGPSFGYGELYTEEPLFGEGKVRSDVGKRGFMIGGKVGGINPLTGDAITKPGDYPQSNSTAIEIELWQILIEKENREAQ